MRVMIYTIFYPAPPEMHTRVDTMVVHYFAKALQDKGHQVQVVHMNCDNLPTLWKKRFQGIIPKEAEYEYDGIPVHLFKITTLIPFQGNPQRFQAAFINRSLKALKRRLGWKPDKVFVHFPTLFTGVTEIFADNVPVLGDFHNIDIRILDKRYLNQEQNAKIEAFVRQLDHWGYRNIRIKARLERIESHSMVRDFSGIEYSILAGEDFIREKLRRGSGTMRILYAGQLIPLKNVDVLIHAVQHLSFDWQFTIVGGGPEEARLKAMAGDDPRIYFTGKLTRQETVKRMKEADVFIMLSSPETYGLVYLESMAQGCINIASRGEGFDGIITEGVEGFLANPGSVEAAVETMERVHAMPRDVREQMILNSYRLAASMTEDQTAQRFLEANV